MLNTEYVYFLLRSVQQKYGVNVSQKRVENALRSVSPHYHARRQTDIEQRVNSVPYRADYFGHKLHVDQNEKLETYGVVPVVANNAKKEQ